MCSRLGLRLAEIGSWLADGCDGRLVGLWRLGWLAVDVGSLRTTTWSGATPRRTVGDINPGLRSKVGGSTFLWILFGDSWPGKSIHWFVLLGSSQENHIHNQRWTARANHSTNRHALQIEPLSNEAHTHSVMLSRRIRLFSRLLPSTFEPFSRPAMLTRAWVTTPACNAIWPGGTVDKNCSQSFGENVRDCNSWCKGR